MSLGFLTESALIPKKANPIAVDSSSILDLKAVVFEREQQLKGDSQPHAGLRQVQHMDISRNEVSHNLFVSFLKKRRLTSQESLNARLGKRMKKQMKVNKGVAERNKKDLEAKEAAKKTNKKRMAQLAAKAAIYERMGNCSTPSI